MTRRHLAVLPAAPFSRRRGRHCRHGSMTGWTGLADVRPAMVFPRRRTPSGVTPLAADDVISLPAAYRRPYDSPKDAA